MQDFSPWNHRKVLVTGGAGFIGGTLVACLQSQGALVEVLDLQAGAIADVVYHQDSITDAEAVALRVADCDTVFHLAARVADWGPDAWFEQLNVEGTRIVLEAARRAGCRRFVHMSSVAVLEYRRGWLDAPESERWEGPAMGGYGRSKRRAEEIVRDAHGKGIETTIIRPGMVPFGPGDRTSFSLMADAVRKRIPLLLNGGTAQFGTAYAPELVRGMALAALKDEGAGELFHIADQIRTDWRSWVRLIAEGLNLRPNLRSFPVAPLRPVAWLIEGLSRISGWRFAPPLTRYRLAAGSCDLHFSPAKAQKKLGFVSRTVLPDAMATTIEWYKNLNPKGEN